GVDRSAAQPDGRVLGARRPVPPQGRPRPGHRGARARARAEPDVEPVDLVPARRVGARRGLRLGGPADRRTAVARGVRGTDGVDAALERPFPGPHDARRGVHARRSPRTGPRARPAGPRRRRAERRARARGLGAPAPRRDRAQVRARGRGACGRVVPSRADPGDRARHAPADRPLPARPWRDGSAPRRRDGRGGAPRHGRHLPLPAREMARAKIGRAYFRFRRLTLPPCFLTTFCIARTSLSIAFGVLGRLTENDTRTFLPDGFTIGIPHPPLPWVDCSPLPRPTAARLRFPRRTHRRGRSPPAYPTPSPYNSLPARRTRPRYPPVRRGPGART